MIRRIFADLPGFKQLDFHPGFNVLLAEKSLGATEKHTRNRSGKSSILEVIHFLLGASCDPKKSIFADEPLKTVTFGMEFDLDRMPVTVMRKGAEKSRVLIEADVTAWPVGLTEKNGSLGLSNEDWKSTVLPQLGFGMRDSPEVTKWAPSFRSCLGYFVRRDREGGMKDPLISNNHQKPVDLQVNLSFLLGLDWRLPREWQTLREREKSLAELKKAMRSGAFGAEIEKASQLKTKLILADDRLRKLREAVTSFKVHDEYRQLEQEASKLTRELAHFVDENLVDRRYLAELEAVVVTEVPPAASDLQEVFRHACPAC